jgi:periplasmic protein TonB
MKTQISTPKSETLEDIVFEGRNKSYGAFELNKKSRKYMVIAFLISFMGVSTAVAVPFLKSLNQGGMGNHELDNGIEVRLSDTGQIKPDDLLPPLPPPIKNIENLVANIQPVVVEHPSDEDIPLMINEDRLSGTINNPVDPEIPTIDVDPTPVPVGDFDEPVYSPQEPAMFQGGDVMNFRDWVSENIKYPEEASREAIFGKVIVQFCVNKKGEVVDIKLLRTIDPALDNETLRVISSSPRWIPAKQGGSPVKQLFVIPLLFEMR